MLFAAVSAFYFYERHTGTQARATPVAIPSNTIETMQTQIDRDNQLLSQVNSELGEAVPAPMQPLRVSESVASSSLQTSSSGKRN